MFRFSLLFCAALIFGITAKPYKPWNKLTDEAFQETLMSIDGQGKMSWGVEVEPPEDMDDTDYNIDPRMKIWKGMTGSEQDKQLKGEEAEEDLDELHHLSMADLLKVQIQKLGALPVPDIQVDPLQEGEVDSEEPEQDRDEVYRKVREELGGYLAPLMADYKAGAEVRVAHSEPEKDEDEVHHHDHDQYSPVQIEPLGHEVRGESEVRVHLQPEEDIDHLYHKDVLQPIPYQGDTEAAAPVYVPSQRKYSEPEEDLDHLYHQ